MTTPTYLTHDQMKQVLLDKFENGNLETYVVEEIIVFDDLKEEKFQDYFSFENFDWNAEGTCGAEKEDWLEEMDTFDYYTMRFMEASGDRHGAFFYYNAIFTRREPHAR